MNVAKWRAAAFWTTGFECPFPSAFGGGQLIESKP